MLMKLPLWSEKCHLESDNGYQRILLFNLESLSVDIGIGACVTFAMICLFHDEINIHFSQKDYGDYCRKTERHTLLSFHISTINYNIVMPYAVSTRKQTLPAHYTCCYPHTPCYLK